MQIVEFRLPAEVAAEALPDEGIRGAGDIQVLIDCLDVASGLITVAGLRRSLPELARRVRTWRSGQAEDGEPAPVLVVQGPGVRVELPLPPNVSVQDIVDAVAKALPAQEDDGSGST
ncbi:MAG: hypothetical protein HOV87_03015 [Catenulispora sp.]|nr:hypothetical protein [Catenulispora sp.]